jgi:hypothetical protein
MNQRYMIRGASSYTRVTPPGFPVVLGRRKVNGSAPVNTAAPVVTGIPQSSNKLTCDPGTWTGQDLISFQWFKDQVMIPGQNGTQLTLNSTYIGSLVGCVVTGSNLYGATHARSNEIEVIP